MFNRLLIAFIACFACASQSAEPARERISVLVQATHAAGVSGLAFSPDNRYLVSVGRDGGAKVFDVATGLVVNETQPCAYWIHAVTFVSANDILMSCGDNRLLRWSIASESPATVAFTSPDSYAVNLTVMPSRPDLMVAVDNLDRVSVRSVANVSTPLWEARVGRRVRVMQSGPDEILLVYVTVQGGKASVTLERRRLSSGDQLSRVQPEWLNAFDFMTVGEGNKVYGVATLEAQPQQQGGTSNVVIDAITGQYLDLHPALGKDFVSRFVWDGAGTLIGVGDNGDVVRWQPGSLNVETANVGRRFTFGTEGAYAFSSGARRLAWVSFTGTVAQVPLSQAGPRSETIAAPIGVSSVAVSGNDELAAVGFFNGTTQLWSLTEGKVVAATRAERVDSIYQLNFDAQGRVLISSGSGVLHAWNAVTDERWRVADAGQRPWNSWSHYRLPMACSRATKSYGCGPPVPMPPIMRAIDNDRIEGSFETTSMAHTGGKVAVAGEFNLMLIDDLRNGTYRDLRQYLVGYSDARAIAMSHDASRLAIARRGAKALDILNLSDNSVQTIALPGPAMTLKFIPGSSSTLLAIVGGGQLFEVEIGATAAQAKTTLRGTATDDAALALAISDDGNYVAEGGHGGRIHLWDRGKGWKYTTLEGHTASVMSLEFMHRKPLLLSGSRDGSVRVWNYTSSTQLAQLQTFADGPWLTTDADGFFDGPEEAWRRVLMRVDGTSAALTPNRLAQLLFEPGLLSEVVRTGQPYRNTLLARGDDRARLSPRKLAARVPPTITVSSPMPVREGVASINVQVTNGGDGMRDLRIFRNGTRTAWVDGPLQAEAAASSFVRTFEVPLASGANRISAYAFDDIGVQSEEAEAQIAFTPTSPRQARVFALSVGINNYDDSSRIKALRYAEADAEVFYESMATAFASRSDVARPVRREIVHGKDASRENILSVISALSACGTGTPSTLFGGDCPGPDDVVVIFLAGHGVKLDGRFLFLARNSVGADVTSIVDTAISDADLEKVLAGIDARRVMLVIDSCHSGAVAADSGQRVGPFNTRGLAQLAYEKGMYVLGASQSYQAALEVDRHRHGLLTYALVKEGLLDLSADFSPHNGRILDEEWLRFPVGRVPELQRKVLSERIARGQQLWFPDDGVSTTAIGSVQVPSFYAPPTRGAEPFIMSQ